MRTGVKDRLSKQEIEYEANAIRDQECERRPRDGRHAAPRCVRINIAGEKDESGRNRTNPCTHGSSRSDRLVVIKDEAKESYYREEHDGGQDLRDRWNQMES